MFFDLLSCDGVAGMHHDVFVNRQVAPGAFCRTRKVQDDHRRQDRSNAQGVIPVERLPEHQAAEQRGHHGLYKGQHRRLAGLHVTVNNGTAALSAGTRGAEASDEFLFAVASTMPGATAETVATVDSEALGIHITVFDYGDDTKEYSAGTKLDDMAYIVSNNKDTANDYKPHAANQLVKPYLESGLPSSKTKGAMTGLFGSGGAIKYSQDQVTNLFLKSYYDENGMFRYRSEDNFAYLGKNGNKNFTVYRQAATPYTTDTQPGHTYYYHGHYMPFNDIDMNQHVGRLMNQYGNDYQNGQAIGELPIGDGRTYEEIYGTQGIPNFYTGMKMEATFSQPRDGKMENGDDMVFKFTGDDDMWVYIDGVLVLDIGGIHEPLSGTINFRTGKVTNPTGSSLAGTETLYQIFQNVLKAYGTPQSVKDKINSIEWKDVDGDGIPDTFADYTNHDFKAFYMERGAGASNLDLQFNLKTVLTDKFTVGKELPEDIDVHYVNQAYRFQATFLDDTDTVNGQPKEKPLYRGAKKKDGTDVCNKVYYQGHRKPETGEPVEDPITVDNDGIFTLKPGEVAVFLLTDENIKYNVKEVDVSQYNLEKIQINGTDTDHVNINDNPTVVTNNQAEAGASMARDRSSVLYTNFPKTQNLEITKHITVHKPEEGTNPVFEFHVYLETTTEEGVHKLVPYSRGPYYLVKMNDDNQLHYYTLTRRDDTKGWTNLPEDKGTTPSICSITGSSGSISRIPPEFTIVIPKLAIGTHFYVVERLDNIPEGYSYDHENLESGTYDASSLTNPQIDRQLANDETEVSTDIDVGTIGKIKDGVNAKAHVYNRFWPPETDVTLKKVDKEHVNDNDPDLLKGAAFTLSRYSEKGATSKDTTWGTDGSMTLRDEKKTDGTYTLNGEFHFTGLTPGYYVINEIACPAGYIRLSKNPAFSIVADASGNLSITLDEGADGLKVVDNGFTIIVGNTPGAKLPSTGGSGVAGIYAIGSLLVLAAAILLVGE